MEEVELIKSIGVLNLRKNDMLVIKIENHSTNEQAIRVRKYIAEVAGLPELKVLILNGNTDVGVLERKKRRNEHPTHKL